MQSKIIPPKRFFAFLYIVVIFWHIVFYKILNLHWQMLFLCSEYPLISHTKTNDIFCLFVIFQNWLKYWWCCSECGGSTQWNSEILSVSDIKSMANDQDICRPNIVFHYICCIYGIRQDSPPPIPSLSSYSKNEDQVIKIKADYTRLFLNPLQYI